MCYRRDLDTGPINSVTLILAFAPIVGLLLLILLGLARLLEVLL